MIATYAFLAAFTVQILVVSILHPGWVARWAHAKAQVQFLGWDGKSIVRALILYRVVNTSIAVLGLVLLDRLFKLTQGPHWDIRAVMRLVSVYSVVQILPFLLVSLISSWGKRKAHIRAPLEVRRTASLQRRGLFDIVSPVTVVLVGLAYVLFAAFVVSVQQRPFPEFPGFAGYRLLGIVTAVFVLNAFFIYWAMYRRKRWPLETRAYRTRAVQLGINMILYTSIAITVFGSLTVALPLLHLWKWVPFATSVYFLTIILFTSMQLFALRRQAEADRLSVSPAS